MGRSLVTARPTTMARPSGRSMVWSPVVLMSLNPGTSLPRDRVIYVPLPIALTARGDGQGLQDRAGFALGFLELARRVAVGDDAGAGLHVRAAAPENCGAERDGGVERPRPPTDVPDRASVRPPPSRLQL